MSDDLNTLLLEHPGIAIWPRVHQGQRYWCADDANSHRRFVVGATPLEAVQECIKDSARREMVKQGI